jgi:UDP-2,4-diacetamido-2,4,6-trideoxy-beta-L-altropyranose hydrolase
MRIAFRTDSSLQIGAGHVMRCLTLADAMRERGAQCYFVCRPNPGHLFDLINQRGHNIFPLPDLKQVNASKLTGTAHAAWLGTDWASDAKDTLKALNDNLGSNAIDWLVVDHYALDIRWENALRQSARRVMVIDDLADRAHNCEVLLDQTYGRETDDYRALVSGKCNLLCGSQYALLRPEFSALRTYSMQRRAQPALSELLVSMGGVDKDNATSRVLKALCIIPMLTGCKITVVMGATAPWLNEVNSMAFDMPLPIRVLVGVSDMAQLMADSDLAIGAAGATSLERCCLGLPSIMAIQAENQRKVARGLVEAGAALPFSPLIAEYQLEPIISSLISNPQRLIAMSNAAAQIVDGDGIRMISAVFET